MPRETGVCGPPDWSADKDVGGTFGKHRSAAAGTVRKDALPLTVQSLPEPTES